VRFIFLGISVYPTKLLPPSYFPHCLAPLAGVIFGCIYAKHSWPALGSKHKKDVARNFHGTFFGEATEQHGTVVAFKSFTILFAPFGMS
jgi:hypothetical protein